MDPSEADEQPDAPFAGMNYDPKGRSPSTSAIGPLARDLAALYGATPRHALAAAILIDQGKAEDALELLDMDYHARLEKAAADKAARRRVPQ